MSIIAVIVTTRANYKSRAIYGLEEVALRKVDGTRDDKDRGIKEISEKLQSGRYAIQGRQDRTDGDWAVILAQVKK